MSGLAGFLLGASVAVAVVAPAQSAFAPDGNWWLGQSARNQGYFLYGEADCYENKVDKSALADGTDDDALRMISSYYTSASARRQERVLDVIHKVIHYHHTPTAMEKGANEYGTPHGVFTGDFWANNKLSERKAFIQGYVACKVKYLKFKPGRTLDGYERYVSRWFGVEGVYPVDSDQIGSRKRTEGTAIADIIDRAG